MKLSWAEADQIIDELYRDREIIFGNIKPKKLEAYNDTQSLLHKTDVSADRNYQRNFNGFYRVRQKSESWYEFYFDLLEREKENNHLTFDAVLRKMYEFKGNVETSFSSKLVATVRPDMPVYDEKVREKLSIKKPRSRNSETRLKEALDAYANIETFFLAALSSDAFRTLETEFDLRLSKFSHLTLTKKLDILLWQWRV